MREVIPFVDRDKWLEERLKDITSTEASALLGLSPYDTAFSLYHRKREKNVVTDSASERMTWGTRLESAIAKGIAEDRSWTIRPMTEYIRDKENRVGASFDYFIESEDALLEIKNVDAMAFREGWIVEDGEILEAPPHIEIQVQTQMHVADKDTAWIGALVGGNSVKLIKRHRDPEVVNHILHQAYKFWTNVDSNIAPQVDYERDAKLITKLYKNVNPCTVLDARGNELLLQLAKEYANASKEEKAAATKKLELKAKILQHIQDNEKVFSDEFTISAGLVKGGPISYNREDYRNFKLTFKKGQNE